MSFQSRWMPVVTITGSSLMVGCGGNYGGSCGYSSYGSSACAPPSSPGTGYYEGTLTNPGQAQTPVVAIIAENGEGRISGTDGTYYRLSVAGGGNLLSGSFNAFSQGPKFPDGTLADGGTFSATLLPSGFNGTLQYTAGGAGALMLQFDTVYNLGSSLSTLAGTWSYTANGFSWTVTVRPDGTFSAVDSNSCSYTGAFSLIVPNFNAYGENYVRTCNGTPVTFTGLATYFPPTNGVNAEIKMLADNDAGEFLVADLQ